MTRVSPLRQAGHTMTSASPARRKGGYFEAPILNSFVPHTGHAPCTAGRPFFMVICVGSLISLLALHFTQYASGIYLTPSKWSAASHAKDRPAEVRRPLQHGPNHTGSLFRRGLHAPLHGTRPKDQLFAFVCRFGH